MTLTTALRLNGAAARIGQFIALGIPNTLQWEFVHEVASSSLAQLQTAREQVEAHNRSGPAVNGVRTIYVVCTDELLPVVKAWADKMVNQQPETN